MKGFNQAAELYLRHYNRLFWLMFSVAGAIFILTLALGMLSQGYLDIALGLALSVIGLSRIGEEFFHRSTRGIQEDSVRAINELLQWAEKSYDYTREFKERHDKRIYNLDRKRAEHEAKVEEEYRSTASKVIQLENKLTNAARAMVEEKLLLEKERKALAKLEELTAGVLKERRYIERRVLELNQNQFRALQLLRDRGAMTNKDYRDVFRVSDKRAYAEIMTLVQKGLIKRQGQGRTTHYVIAF